MSITSSSVLAELNISVWLANKLDKGQTDKVIADANASTKAATVHKNLMAGTHLRKEIADFAASCRLWHHNQTLAWSDKGPRLLPTSLFLDYKGEINTRKATFFAMKQNFLLNYPALVQTAGNYLGSMFDPADYPSIEEVTAKFDFRVVFSPLPEAGDFRVDIPVQDLEEAKQDYEVAFNDRLSDAMSGAWGKLHSTLTAMSEKLTDLNGDEKKRYHETLITNAQSLCQMLTHLNITKDPKLEQARKELERVMAGVDIVDIKDSAIVRADTKAKLDSILKQYEW